MHISFLSFVYSTNFPKNKYFLCYIYYIYYEFVYVLYDKYMVLVVVLFTPVRIYKSSSTQR